MLLVYSLAHIRWAVAVGDPRANFQGCNSPTLLVPSSIWRLFPFEFADARHFPNDSPFTLNYMPIR